MPVNLNGARALLTGATGGIGHSIARALHARGAELILTGRRTDVLADLAAELGLDRGAALDALKTKAYEKDIRADLARARELGISGVPFFVVDGKYAVSGAQPTELFTQLLERAWADAHPALEVVGDGTVCGPDGCAV